MASTHLQALSEFSRGETSRYGRLLELDRAGWAWEWLRRNPDFASSGPASGSRTEARPSIVIQPDLVSERSLLRWGLHYGGG